MIARVDVERDLLVVVLAVSAGIHAALVPQHGATFAAAAVALGLLVLAVRQAPSVPVLAAAAALLAGLIASYAIAVTAGLPLVHPEPEAVTGLALFTKTVELLGLLAAVDLIRPERKPV